MTPRSDSQDSIRKLSDKIYVSVSRREMSREEIDELLSEFAEEIRSDIVKNHAARIYAGNRDSYEKRLAEARNEGAAEMRERARKACWKVVDERIGINDQVVVAFVLGHSQGAYECESQIKNLPLTEPTEGEK